MKTSNVRNVVGGKTQKEDGVEIFELIPGGDEGKFCCLKMAAFPVFCTGGFPK